MAVVDHDVASTLIKDGMGPFWIECVLMLGFSVGFLAFRGNSSKSAPKGKGLAEKNAAEPEFSSQAKKSIEVEFEAGNFAAVLAAWRSVRAAALTPSETLKLVVKAFLEEEPNAMESEVIDHLRSHPEAYSFNHALAAIDAAARGCTAETLESFWSRLRQTCRVPSNSQFYALLLGGYASAGDTARVAATVAEMQALRVRRTAKGFSLTMKGFLKNGLVDAVREQIHEMMAMELEVPSFALIQCARLACEASRGEEYFTEFTQSGLALPEEAVVFFLDDCMKRLDMDLANTIIEFVREHSLKFSQSSQETLLKLYTSAGDLRALELFDDICAQEPGPSETLCERLLARSSESQFVRFAEVVTKFSQARGSMTIAAYSALMKVYAQGGLYGKACDLYDAVLADGLEPDATMYGCLMKFAVECGRTGLSRQLSAKTPSLEIQNFMSLLRAAGRDKDAHTALAVLERLKNSTVKVDMAAYNCALDAVVSAGDLKLAERLVEEMRARCGMDIVSYNTLVKGYCMQGQVARAKALLQEMEAAGHAPNDVSFNSVLNAVASKGDTQEAWAIIGMMEAKGVAVDHFTMSILMKLLRRSSSGHRPAEVQRTLALLDRSGVDVAADEVLLNMVLDLCVRCRELQRLRAILDACLSGKLRPAAHTYGALIKACGSLKWMDKCRMLWQEMTEQRAMEPNAIVLGCMLDALVNNKLLDEAVALFRQWKAKVPPNSIMFSTLMKGFATGHKSKAAMAMWREMCAESLPMNTVVYNAVIDTQARVGAMANVSELVRSMERSGCTPDTITLSTIVKGYCVTGDLDAAFKVYRDMQRDGMVKDAIVCNTLLDGCTKFNRFDLADQLRDEMERCGVVPTNFTLGILAKMWGRRHRLDKAFEAMEELPRRFGFKPNAHVYASLMCACLCNGEVERAHQVFEEAKAAFGVDAKSYASLISGCTRNGDLHRAVGLVREACGISGGGLPAEQELGSEAVEHLLRALMSRGLGNLAAVLVQELRGTKVRLSKQLEATIMSRHA